MSSVEITVRLDSSLPSGRFALKLDPSLTKLHALAFTYGKRLADGNCSCLRAEAVLRAMASELGLTEGSLELRVG
jgi:hypothetical protein